MFVQRSLSLVISSHNIFSKVIFVNSFLPLPLKWGYFTRNTVSFICQSLHSILVPRTSCMIDIYIYVYAYMFLSALGLSRSTPGLHCVTQLFHCSAWTLHTQYTGHGAHDQTRVPGVARWILDHWSNQGSPCTVQCSWSIKLTLRGIRFCRVWWTLGHGCAITAPHPVMSIRQPLTSFFLKVKLFIRINDFMGAYSVFFSFFLLK